MRFAFNYACSIGIVTADGAMTTLIYNAGDVVDIVSPGCLIMEPREYQDFALEDGTVLLNVPLAAITWEPSYAGSV